MVTMPPKSPTRRWIETDREFPPAGTRLHALADVRMQHVLVVVVPGLDRHAPSRKTCASAAMTVQHFRERHSNSP